MTPTIWPLSLLVHGQRLQPSQSTGFTSALRGFCYAVIPLDHVRLNVALVCAVWLWTTCVYSYMLVEPGNEVQPDGYSARSSIYHWRISLASNWKRCARMCCNNPTVATAPRLLFCAWKCCYGVELQPLQNLLILRAFVTTSFVPSWLSWF